MILAFYFSCTPLCVCIKIFKVLHSNWDILFHGNSSLSGNFITLLLIFLSITQVATLGDSYSNEILFDTYWRIGVCIHFPCPFNTLYFLSKKKIITPANSSIASVFSILSICFLMADDVNLPFLSSTLIIVTLF